MSAPVVLALETSTTRAHVALVDESGRVLAEGSAPGPRFSDALLPCIDQVLQKAKLTPGDLAGIACGAGPGHFTGLRVGLACAKGLALPSERPLLLVPSLGALALDMAAASPRAAVLCPCLDAGKGEVYAATADGAGVLGAEVWRETPAALVARLEALPAPPHVGGPGVDRHREAFAAATRLSLVDVVGPTALSVARLAWRRLAAGERDSLDAALPDYGRPPDITRPKPR